MTYKPVHSKKGVGRRPKPIDPRVVEALEQTYRRGVPAEIELVESDQTGDITQLVNMIKRAGYTNFPEQSTRVHAPKQRRGILRFFLTDKNPNLARHRKEDP
jgi:hypothetical protein